MDFEGFKQVVLKNAKEARELPNFDAGVFKDITGIDYCE